jgi:hypothetical protein
LVVLVGVVVVVVVVVLLVVLLVLGPRSIYYSGTNRKKIPGDKGCGHVL